MVRVRVRENDAEQRLAERLGVRAQAASAGHRQRRVDGDDAVGALDQVRVDRRVRRLGAVAMDEQGSHDPDGTRVGTGRQVGTF